MPVVSAAIAVGNAVLATVGISVSSVALIAGVGFATQAALGLALNALTPKPSISNLGRKERGYNVNQRQPALDHQIIYGRARVGGAIVFQGTTGNNNKFLHQVVAYTGHEIEEFEEIYINDAKVTNLEADGNVKEVELPDGTTSNRYDGKLRIKKHLGESNQAADSDLVSEVPKWTNEHRLRGIAYLYCRFEFDQDTYPNGVPQITTTIKGKKVYDPRTDTVAWSDNPALCLRDYLTSDYGLSEGAANIDDTLVQDAANVCDETALNGEKRYTCNGNFTTELAPYDALNDLLTSMGGLLWYAQGEWRMKPAYWTSPEITLTEDDLRSEISVQTRHSRRDNFNTVKGTFRGEETGWQTADFPEVTNQAFLNADNGQESVIDLELPFTDNSDEARRIGRIALERNRQQLTVQASWGLRAFQVQVGSIVNLSIDRFGWNQKTFEVSSWTFGLTDAQDLQVQMTLREISENVFDEVDDGVIYERDNTTLPTPFITVAPENLSVSDGGFTTEDGTFVNSFIVEWDAPDDAFVDYYELEWRVQGDSTFKGTSLRSTEYQIAPVLESQTYEIRVKAINTFGVSGPYASTTAIVGGDTTAPGLPTGLTATGGFKYITVDWTNPPEADLNYVEVWENTSNTTVGANLVGEVWGTQFVRTGLNISETRFYFLRAVDFSGNKSGYTSGVSATTTFVDDVDFENGIRSLFEEQGLYPIEDVDSLPPSGILNRKVFNRADGKLYEWNGSSWVLVVSAVEAPDISGELQTNQIALDAVTSDLIANDAVQSENIANLAVNEAKISDSAITTTKIANTAVEEGKLALSAVTADKIANLAVNEAKISDSAITTTKIANAAVESGNLANNAATEAKIATSAITETKIASGAITTPKISAGAVTATEIAAGSITTGKIDAGAVTASEIAAGTITSNEIATNSITAGNIAAGAITASELSTNSVTAIKIASDSITTGKIAAGAVTASEIAAGSITSNEIATNTITSGEIASGAITTNELAAGSVTATEIASESIISSKIAAGAVTATEIAAGSITSNEIASDTITANNIATETITADEISGNTITGDKIVANTITGGLLATSGIITNSAQINDALITNAKIDNAAITSAKIDDLAVDTIKIADRAVTSQVSVQAPGTSAGGSVWKSAGSVSFYAVGGEEVLFGTTFKWTVEVFGSCRVRIKFNGAEIARRTELAEPNSFGDDSPRDFYPAMIYSGIAASGTNVIELETNVFNSNDGRSNVIDPTIFALIARK